jgi:hypothetical protein
MPKSAMIVLLLLAAALASGEFVEVRVPVKTSSNKLVFTTAQVLKKRFPHFTHRAKETAMRCLTCTPAIARCSALIWKYARNAA